MYAPMTPDIAPLAPTMGTVEFGAVIACNKVPVIPHTK